MDVNIIVIVGVFANVIATIVGLASLLRSSREQGRWSGTVDSRLREHGDTFRRHETRLNAHSAAIDDVRIKLARSEAGGS